MKKILVIGLGGTIGSVKTESIGLDNNNLKILDYVKFEDFEFQGVSPFSILSENMSVSLWKKLLSYLDSVDFEKYAGTIVLHGSDTLAFTSSIVANAFPNEKIVLVAADKPIEDKNSNGVANFIMAVDAIRKGVKFPMVAYDNLYRANCITSADVNDKFVAIEDTIPVANIKTILDKKVLIINAYVGMDLAYYNLNNVDAVLVNMYHSATVPTSFAEQIGQAQIPVYYVTHKSSADYETANGLGNIIYNCTIENAFAKIMLTNDDLVL